MLPVDIGQLEDVKGELLKLKKRDTSSSKSWYNVTRTEERSKQKKKEIDYYQLWHNLQKNIFKCY